MSGTTRNRAGDSGSWLTARVRACGTAIPAPASGHGDHVRRPGRASLAMLLAAALMLASGCAAGHGKPGPLRSLGPGERSLRLLGVAGDVQYGGTDPRVDWVSSFQRRTGCQVSFTPVPAVGALVRQFSRHGGGDYDGVLAPPVMAGRLIRAGLIAPLNVRLVGGYSRITPPLRGQAAVMSGGRIFGVPYLWSSYVLGYRTQAIHPPPRGWAAVFAPAPAARHAGGVLLPDSPLTIALAALYLRSANPALRITDPYELTPAQFAAVTGLLKSLRRSATRYYGNDTDVVAGLASGSADLGAVVARQVGILAAAGRKVAGMNPAAGTTGSVNFWLLGAKAQHPNCMYEWMTWSLSAQVQQQAAEWTGAAPVNPAACGGPGRSLCATGDVAGAADLGRVAFAHMPVPACAGGRNGCVGWARWADTWTSIVHGGIGRT